jgi:competence protein ComEC
MKNRKIIYWILAALLVLAAVGGWMIFFLQRSSELKMVFLNVGQGDAILISQGSNQILVDGGKSGKIVLEKLGKYIPFWDRKIEAIIITHPDFDHIAGLIDVLKSYDVKTVIRTDAKSNSATFGKLSESISAEQAKEVEARRGVALDFPGGAKMEIEYPFSKEDYILSKNTNDGSVVAKVVFGGNSFLLTGDFPIEKEEILVSSSENIQSQFLKISHHGSKYSTSDNFLEKVKPAEAVISVGKNNYGHPSSEVIERLERNGVKIRRTDQSGDVIYRCTEENCTVEEER